MIININNFKLNLESLQKISSGKDGELYRYKDLVIKLNNSQYMTEEKIRDLQVAKDSTRLIIPIDIVNPTPKELLKKENPCFGYTTKYLEEDSFGLLNLTTIDYLNELELIKQDVHKFFSSNEIAITDTNPHNLLISNGVIHLIDFDRNITKSSMYSLKEVVLNNKHENPYNHHNNVRIKLLTYKGLLLSIADYAKKEKIRCKKLDNYINKLYDYPSNIEETVRDFEKYDYIYDYAKEKVKAITK